MQVGPILRSKTLAQAVLEYPTEHVARRRVLVGALKVGKGRTLSLSDSLSMAGQAQAPAIGYEESGIV